MTDTEEWRRAGREGWEGPQEKLRWVSTKRQSPEVEVGWEEGHLQAGCYRPEGKTGERRAANRKDSENRLAGSQPGVATGF